MVKWPHGDPIPGTPLRNAIANCFDRARHLVSNDLWKLDAVIHIAVKDMEVRSADAAMGNADLHLSGTGLHGRAGASRDTLMTLVEGCFHKNSILSSNCGELRIV